MYNSNIKIKLNRQNKIMGEIKKAIKEYLSLIKTHSVDDLTWFLFSFGLGCVGFSLFSDWKLSIVCLAISIIQLGLFLILKQPKITLKKLLLGICLPIVATIFLNSYPSQQVFFYTLWSFWAEVGVSLLFYISFGSVIWLLSQKKSKKLIASFRA